MKNIFRAAAQTSTFLKSISVLMLVLLVGFSVTSCENQTKTISTDKSEVVSETEVVNAATLVDTEDPLMEMGYNSEIENRRLCIEGGAAGHERSSLDIGGYQTAPRSLSEFGVNQVPPRLLTIGGSGSLPPRSVIEVTPDVILIGGNSYPRS
ncbi:MAG: hypothetical protein H7339_17255 [Arcicella sp.]|nr:hypothetical protein [Arcicella sp.]